MQLTVRTAIAAAACAALLGTVAACGSNGSTTPSRPSTAPAPTSSSNPGGGAPAAAAVGSYHGDARRTGDYPDVPAPAHLAVGMDRGLDGAVYAQPLVIGNVVVVATEDDTVYALDETTGAIRWQTHVGTPQRASALPCGNITPTVGITGTPVYDPSTGVVYAAAEEAGPKHELVGLDGATGRVVSRVGIDLGVAGTAPNAMQQRSALALANGRVYVSFGGRDGDCGAYRGQVVGVPTAGGALVSYTVPTAREAGAWNPMGPSVDAAGDVWIAVGNGAAGEDAGHLQDAYDDSDAVLELSPALQLRAFYAPSDWRSQNARDADLGSTGPTLLPNGLVLAAGKSPDVYVTRQSAPGGIGGQLSRTSVCTGFGSFGGTAQSGSTVYVPCTDGVRAVAVSSTGAVSVLWQADPSLTGSPVLGGGAVWSIDRSAPRLVAVSQQTGKTIAQVHLPAGVNRFATPALVGGRALVGTLSGVVCVTGA